MHGGVEFAAVGVGEEGKGGLEGGIAEDGDFGRSWGGGMVALADGDDAQADGEGEEEEGDDFHAC